MKKTRFLLCIAMMFCWLTLMSIACDPSRTDQYYFKNGTSEPIIYTEMTANGDQQRNTDTLQPGESKLVFYSSHFTSDLLDNSDILWTFSNLYIPTLKRSIIFNDSIYISWDIDNTLNFEKHPKYRSCWQTISSVIKKHYSNISVEYTIDSVDYQNAIEYCRQQNP